LPEKKLREKLGVKPTVRAQNPEVKIPENMLKGLVASDDESYEKIVLAMIDEDNVDMKTEIHATVEMTQFDILAMWYDFEGVPECGNLIREFGKRYRINQVSHNRESRKEIRDILTEGLKAERSMAQKMAGKPGV
jgi:hypothetical protein